MRKGEITAFLSLIFVLLLSFILAMAESASIQTIKNRKRLDADRAVFSFLGNTKKSFVKNMRYLLLMVRMRQGNLMKTCFWTGCPTMEAQGSSRKLQIFRS